METSEVKYTRDALQAMAKERPRDLVALVQGGVMGVVSLAHAIEYLEDLPLDETAAVLRERAGHAHPLVRECVLNALLLHRRDERARAIMESLSRDPIPEIRSYALYILRMDT